MYEDFDSVKFQELELAQWVTLFKYVEESAKSTGTVEPKTVQRLTKLDAIPRKWAKIDADSPPDVNLGGGVPEVDEWTWGWYGQYATWTALTGEEINDLRASIYQLRAHVGSPVTGSEGVHPSTMWEGICAARNDLESARRELHAAVATLWQRVDGANKCAKDAEGLAQAAGAGVRGIGARVAMLENGSRPKIDVLRQTMKKVIRDAATGQDIDDLVASLTGELKTAFGDVL